jgi:hypothetical protein
VQDLLHVQGDEEEHREEPGEGDQLGQVWGYKSFHPQNGEREQGVAAALEPG